ncbi:uncharacterized protein MONBRDRAFT_32868 [Monosiga brevicollis MX1]|uniref:PH domain-containing protein n=1 Tax=Monosiga brevicollis TaxID=81824 RepID=A9V269_MONBE|nr:uncharacterized protein MONBRDRAFT_32868 [Monosiga brevicollis MX1]EDQ88202.1 predicted protein [Monosiga brevicollis MX1]|eukprot:XP_001746795.1 hypothetical protein [Monosiga brevicollis MX1]
MFGRRQSAPQGAGAPDGSGTVLLQGHLYKQGKIFPTWRRRWMVLYQDGHIDYFKPRATVHSPLGREKGAIWHIKAVVAGSDLGLVPWPRDAAASCRFSLPTRAERTYHLYAESQVEADRWKRALISLSDTKRLITYDELLRGDVRILIEYVALYGKGGTAAGARQQLSSQEYNPHEEGAKIEY